MTVKPYTQEESKKAQVEQMFDNIAPTYDVLNRSTSMGTDVRWRKKMIAKLKSEKPRKILDVATGTADVAIAMAKQLQPERIVGLDLSAVMLSYGQKKIQKKNLTDIIELVQGDSEQLPFEDDSFDAVTVSFGVRNFENLEKGLAELLRVTRPGGQIVVLEFSKIGFAPLRWLFNLYFGYIMPLIGRLSSKDPRAYKYLFESVQEFPSGREFTGILRRLGYKQATCQPLSFGIASIYSAYKPS
ncbi:MAG: bifunctional demethylmenaquinone methyltransferase/2-methoxy-6-polyprenyl-1,4-benzoquinol methylase UbiE [Bacteroidota bacterium]